MAFIHRRREIAIGDIHGCSVTFEALIYNILKITKDDSIYILGDLIDRGPNPKAVVDSVLKLRSKGFSIQSIMGNHEKMLLDSLYSLSALYAWASNGSKTTLRSFNVEMPSQLDIKYKEFFFSLPYYLEVRNFILVHAGINFLAPDPFADKESMLWMRDHPIFKDKINGRRLICGHTPKPLDEIRASLLSDKVYLDGGCVYKNVKKNQGNLCALDLHTHELFVQENVDF
ncbi:MAG: metallophosphoesterase [Ignavibacteria bacterium]|nr:metallophosphoesterase [Ignavibacteria bacterium]